MSKKDARLEDGKIGRLLEDFNALCRDFCSAPGYEGPQTEESWEHGFDQGQYSTAELIVNLLPHSLTENLDRENHTFSDGYEISYLQILSDIWSYDPQKQASFRKWLFDTLPGQDIERLNEVLGELEDKYFDLVWYARSEPVSFPLDASDEQKASIASKRLSIEGKYPEETEWVGRISTCQGFNSGVLAMVRFALDLQPYECMAEEIEELEAEIEELESEDKPELLRGLGVKEIDGKWFHVPSSFSEIYYPNLES